MTDLDVAQLERGIIARARRRGARAALTRLGEASVVLIALCAGALLWDAADPLVWWVRLGAIAALVLASVVGLARAGFAAVRRLRDRAGAAACVRDSDDGVLTAWELRPRANDGDPVTRALARRSIARGVASLADATPLPLVTRAGRRAWGISVALLVIAVIVGVVFPRLWAMTLPRLVDPTGLHPPFSMLEFVVEHEPPALGPGDTLLVRARVGPEQPRTAPVLEWRAANELRRGPWRASAMRPDGQGGFVAELNNAPSPMMYRVRVGRSWSIPVVVPRRDEARVLQATLDVAPPAYTGRRATRLEITPRVRGRDAPAEPIVVAEGSRLALSVETDHALESLRANAQPELHATPSVTVDGVRGRVAWAARRVHRLRVEPLAAQSVMCRDIVALAIEVVRDQPPTLAWIDEAEDVPIVAVGETVTLGLRARDDFGVTRLRVVDDREAGSRPDEIDLSTTTDLTHEARLTPERRPGRPVYTITLRAQAFDNRPKTLSGAQASMVLERTVLVVDLEQAMASGSGAVSERLRDLAQRASMQRADDTAASGTSTDTTIGEANASGSSEGERRAAEAAQEGTGERANDEATEATASPGEGPSSGVTTQRPDVELERITAADAAAARGEAMRRVERLYERSGWTSGVEAMDARAIPERYRALVEAYYRSLADMDKEDTQP